MVVALGSIIRDVIAHNNGCIYLWLCLGRLELVILFTVIL
jgi:hypothetical protein